MIVRTAQPGDRAAIDALAKILHGPDAPSVTPVRQESRTFVLETPAGIGGFAIVTLVDYGLSRTAVLEELVVEEHLRGAGHGGELVQACEDWLNGEGIEVLFVSLLPGAEPFYRKLGFTPCVGPWFHRPLHAITG